MLVKNILYELDDCITLAQGILAQDRKANTPALNKCVNHISAAIKWLTKYGNPAVIEQTLFEESLLHTKVIRKLLSDPLVNGIAGKASLH